MRDRERDLWTVGAGRFLSHSEDLQTGLHSLSIQRLDALIYTEDKKQEVSGGKLVKKSSVKSVDGSRAKMVVEEASMSLCEFSEDSEEDDKIRITMPKEQGLKMCHKAAVDHDHGFIEDLVRGLCDDAVEAAHVVVRRSRTTCNQKIQNRHRSVVEVEEAVNKILVNDLTDYVIDENDNKSFKPKKKKKLSFSSIFGRKPKKNEEEEAYDHFDSNKGLFKSKKFASAMELSSKPLERTPSFIKRLRHMSEDSSKFLKRSFSFRDVTGKRKNYREKISEQKASEWQQSLQSLVESDLNVSYTDFSFVNYDTFNDINYDNVRTSRISRTQSMSDQRSPEFRRPSYQRNTSVSEKESESASLSEQSGAFSLPSLCHTSTPERVEAESENGTLTHRYQRRPQSIGSEDGSSRMRQRGSFRSVGCPKLKRHNACRQKSREACRSLNIIEKRTESSDRTVRSRSLNHLDRLEMRQGVVSTAESALTLKDSRSEPDCTKPVLAPPSVHPEPPTPSDVPPPRKHMLSRSQKSSSECFSVNFEVGDESIWDNEIFFNAKRGVTLYDYIFKLCDNQKIDLSGCEARLQDRENNTESLISLQQDTGSLVGQHVRITAKEVSSSSNKRPHGSFYGHSRKPSGSCRPRTSSNFFSSSTEEATTVASSTLSLHDSDQNKRQSKKGFSYIFGSTKDSKYEALIDQLDKFSKQGIPTSPYYAAGQCESVDALHKLENDWRDIIKYDDLNEKQQQQQTALWELIKTEAAYIKTLKVVTDLFLSCLKELQNKNLLKEIDTEKLFSNITEILDANVVFWRNTLFPLVKDMRKYKRPSCIENMLEGFARIYDVFKPYFKYCAEQSRCQHYCRENLDSEVFTAYLTWCESQKECNRLRLMDILVQPMQRLTKYGLLLKAILKNTDEDVERDNLQRMIKNVDDFVNDVNSSLRMRQDKERLKGIIARIESYDIVDSKDDDIDKILKQHKLTQLDLTRPMLNCAPERKRHLLLEGDLKLKDSGTSKVEVHCFLLTDMLLICKPSTKKGGATMRVIRQPYLVDRLMVQELVRETPSLAVVYKNEFDMAIAAFILQNNDSKKIKAWKEGILKAQALYAQAKQAGYMEESLDADFSSEFIESECHSLQLVPRSPLASSSRASRVSSLAHSHSGSVEMNDQSSVGSAKDHSRGISMENDNRTASISSDEGVQPLPPDKSPVSQKNSFKNRLFNKTPNTLSVQPFGNLGQSLPNLTLGSPNVGSMSLSLNQNTLSVPGGKNGSHLLSPTHRGISYPPPSPTRGNLRRSLAISQSKNPPLIKTRQVNSASSVSSQMVPNSFDFDVPVIAGVSQTEDHCESFSRGHHRQAMKRNYRYHTAGVVDDIKKNDSRDSSIHKRLSWNCTSQEQRPPNEDLT